MRIDLSLFRTCKAGSDACGTRVEGQEFRDCPGSFGTVGNNEIVHADNALDNYYWSISI